MMAIHVQLFVTMGRMSRAPPSPPFPTLPSLCCPRLVLYSPPSHPQRQSPTCPGDHSCDKTLDSALMVAAQTDSRPRACSGMMGSRCAAPEPE